MHQVKMVEVRNHNRKVKLKWTNLIKCFLTVLRYVKLSIGQKKIALNIFEIMIHNAYLLYCQQSGSKMKSQSFREQLVLYLLNDKLFCKPNVKHQRRDGGFIYFFIYLFLFYLYIYPPDSQESDKGTNTYGRQLPRPASGDIKILLSACNLIEI